MFIALRSSFKLSRTYQVLCVLPVLHLGLQSLMHRDQTACISWRRLTVASSLLACLHACTDLNMLLENSSLVQTPFEACHISEYGCAASEWDSDILCSMILLWMSLENQMNEDM